MTDHHWTIDVTREPDSDRNGAYTYRYATVSDPARVMAYLERVTRDIIAAMFPDGDNAYYDYRWELDDPWNPSLAVYAYDHDYNGAFLAGASAQVQVAIDV